MIIGIVAGGLCLICLGYYLIVYCLNRKEKKDIKSRRKRNWVHPDGDISDAKEPVVILPDADANVSADFRVDTDISGVSSL